MDPITIIIHNSDNDPAWDAYVSLHPDATCYQLSAWRRAIEKSYGHRAYYLIALSEPNRPNNAFWPQAAKPSGFRPPSLLASKPF